MRLNANLRLVRIFDLASVSLCDSGLSFRCARTDSSAQVVEARLPLAERELFGSLRVQLALSRMIRSEHCTGEG